MRIKLLLLTIIIYGNMAFADTHKSYTVSNIDINSITCPAGEHVSDIFFSEKSALKVDNRKDRVFVDFSAIIEKSIDHTGQTTEKIMYSTTPVTVTLFCGDDEYNLTLRPKKLKNGVSIKLEHSFEKETTILFEGMKREEQISTIVKTLFTDGVLKGFKKSKGSSVDNIDEISIYLRNSYSGGGFIVKEIYLYTPSKTKINIDNFIRLNFITDPVAISVLDEEFSGWTRAVIVEDAI